MGYVWAVDFAEHYAIVRVAFVAASAVADEPIELVAVGNSVWSVVR